MYTKCVFSSQEQFAISLPRLSFPEPNRNRIAKESRQKGRNEGYKVWGTEYEVYILWACSSSMWSLKRTLMIKNVLTEIGKKQKKRRSQKKDGEKATLGRKDEMGKVIKKMDLALVQFVLVLGVCCD